MLAKCANPSCEAKFLYLREGALFSVESGSSMPKPGLLNGFEQRGPFAVSNTSGCAPDVARPRFCGPREDGSSQ